MKLTAMIKRHEGFRSMPYKDSLGIETIGYGFNLDVWMTQGMSKDEADAIINVKISAAEKEASEHIEGWNNLKEPRRAALIDMVYNIGITKVLKFKKMLRAISKRDFKMAADEMLDSVWARQVGKRAEELSSMMRTGIW